MHNNFLIQTEYSCYRLTDLMLGQGTFGHVQKGISLVNHQQVAIKIISISNLQMAVNQVNILKKLNNFRHQKEEKGIQKESQHGLKFYGTFRSYNQFYIVTELFGISLAKIIQKSITFDYQQVFSLFRSIVWAIKPLRQSKILHRDIKPANILIKLNQRQKIYSAKACDFGLSYFEQKQKNSIFAVDRVGTLVYQSPQVIKFKEYSQKSQIWSLGIILYELIYKKLPFKIKQFRKQNQLYQYLITQPIKFVGMPLVISKLGQKCLSINTNKRFTFNQLQKQLEQVIKKLPILNKQQSINQQTSKQQQLKFQIIDSQKVNQTNMILKQSPNVSISDLSTIEVSRSQCSRRASQQKFQINQNDINHYLVELLKKTYSQLKNRLVNLKKPKKQNEIALINLCDKFIENQPKDNQYLNYFASEVIINLQQSIKKLQIIFQYANNQKQITFNLKQYMLVDTLFILYQVTKLQKQGNQNPIYIIKKCINIFQQHLMLAGQAKSMAYYKDLRKKVISIF